VAQSLQKVNELIMWLNQVFNQEDKAEGYKENKA